MSIMLSLKSALPLAMAFCVIVLVIHLSMMQTQLNAPAAPRSSPAPEVGLPAGPLWRPVNRVLSDFRPDLAERIKRLEEAKTSADSPEVVALARDVIDSIPASAGKSPIKESLSIDQTPQAKSIDEITKEMRDGFFVECGAFDGERASNTNWLEKYRSWTGLLLEMDPFYYTQILGRNRRVWSANLPYSESHNQLGKVNYDPTKLQSNSQTGNDGSSFVPCFPLESLLLAINQTRVDYFSLDVEGLELEVLETIPWTKLDIRTLSVEYIHVPRGSKAVIDFVTGKGYRLAADLRASVDRKNIFVEDSIFARNNTEYFNDDDFLTT